MEAKIKAEELVLQFYEVVKNIYPSTNGMPLAKQCAIIAVDEILNNNCGSHTDESNAINEEIYCDEYYWQEVKTEIKKI